MFVNNVRQEPGVAYTVSGTALTMTGSIASTDDFYVVFQGKSTGTATHPATQNLTAVDGTFTGDLTVDTNTLFVDSTNNEVGIGTLTPGGSLEVYKAGTSEVLIGTDNGGTAQLSLYENNDGTKEGLLKYDGTNNRIHLATSGNADALVIPRDGGDVGIGRNDPQNICGSHGGGLVVQSASGRAATTTQIAFQDSSGNSQFSQLHNGETTFSIGGTAALKIDTNGDVMIGKTTSAFGTPGFFFNESPGQLDITCNQNNPLRLNRVNNDGIMISFQQDSSEEGTVSVSGGTVSYNGGHLSRWSRLLDGSKPPTILKGTVMSNLNDMIVWSHDATDAVLDDDSNEIEPAHDAYTEDNEQLNHTKVSDAEGDIDVAGVFVAWDDRDDFNDFFLAMTGDMVIRIAQGTTVARGDLLMSAGDGTAKPQGDDIVRSKTIAKVTSTNVSHTYDDGSYLVPCVLMAC